MFEELRYQARSAVAWLGGKSTVKLATTGVAQIGGPIAVASGMFGAGMTIFLAQFSMRQDKERLLGFYGPEISAYTRKSPKDLTLSDLKDVAKGNPEKGIEANPVIGQAYDRLSTRRWLKIGVGIAAGVATLLIVGQIAAPLLLAAGVAQGATALSIGAIGWSLSALTAAKIGLGIVIGFTLGTGLGEVAERVTNLDQESATQKISQLQKTLRGRGAVTQEQVMGIVAAAHPQLDNQIKNSYGTHFDDLPLVQKRAVADEYGARINLNRLVEDLNHRQIRATELAFAACGQASGIPRLPEPPPGYGDRVQALAAQALERSRENLSHVWDKGRSKIGHGLEQGRAKLTDAGRYLSSFRNASVEGVALSPKKSEEHLKLLDSVKGKWERLVTSRTASPQMEAAASR